MLQLHGCPAGWVSLTLHTLIIRDVRLEQLRAPELCHSATERDFASMFQHCGRFPAAARTDDGHQQHSNVVPSRRSLNTLHRHSLAVYANAHLTIEMFHPILANPSAATDRLCRQEPGVVSDHGWLLFWPNIGNDKQTLGETCTSPVSTTVLQLVKVPAAAA